MEFLTKLTSLANAVRNITGDTTELTLEQIAEEISNMEIKKE